MDFSTECMGVQSPLGPVKDQTDKATKLTTPDETAWRVTTCLVFALIQSGDRRVSKKCSTDVAPRDVSPDAPRHVHVENGLRLLRVHLAHVRFRAGAQLAMCVIYSEASEPRCLSWKKVLCLEHVDAEVKDIRLIGAIMFHIGVVSILVYKIKQTISKLCKLFKRSTQQSKDLYIVYKPTMIRQSRKDMTFRLNPKH